MEINKSKREYLRDVFSEFEVLADAPPLFGDIASLAGATSAKDYWLGENVPGQVKMSEIPQFSHTAGGFPCKDVSSMNGKRKQNRSIVSEGGGTTGKVFKSLAILVKPSRGDPTTAYGCRWIGPEFSSAIESCSFWLSAGGAVAQSHNPSPPPLVGFRTPPSQAPG